MYVFSIISRFLKQISVGLVNKGDLYSKAFKYLHYKKVFLDEIQKKGSQTEKKTPKSHKNIKMSSKKVFLSDLV